MLLIESNSSLDIESFRLIRYGLAGSSNTTGDDQKKLDVLSNELFINMLKSSYTVYVMASEENENYIEVEVAKQVTSGENVFEIDRPMRSV